MTNLSLILANPIRQLVLTQTTNLILIKYRKQSTKEKKENVLPMRQNRVVIFNTVPLVPNDAF
jgi:hypothetical protein